jgi:hypothetical protein
MIVEGTLKLNSLSWPVNVGTRVAYFKEGSIRTGYVEDIVISHYESNEIALLIYEFQEESKFIVCKRNISEELYSLWIDYDEETEHFSSPIMEDEYENLGWLSEECRVRGEGYLDNSENVEIFDIESVEDEQEEHPNNLSDEEIILRMTNQERTLYQESREIASKLNEEKPDFKIPYEELDQPLP